MILEAKCELNTLIRVRKREKTETRREKGKRKRGKKKRHRGEIKREGQKNCDIFRDCGNIIFILCSKAQRRVMING